MKGKHPQDWVMNAPADMDAILRVEADLGHALPDAYRNFLLEHDGGEGDAPGYSVIFWRVDELIEFNRDYEIAEYAPGLFVFGSSGGGESYAFDTRYREWPIVMAPFIGMSLLDALPTAYDFADFRRILEEGGSPTEEDVRLD